jgi:hypothetical protein
MGLTSLSFFILKVKKMATYTTISRVRGMFGFSTKDIEDTPLGELIVYVDAEVDSITGQSWIEESTYYAKIQEAATILVGSLVYKRFPDKQELSKQLWEEGETKLHEFGRVPYTKATSYEAIEEN